MNIFWLSNNNYLNAEYACDQHIVKMCVEYAQILCTVMRKLGMNHGLMYKSTHENHPCVLWAGRNFSNFYRLYKMLCCYNDQYKVRFAKSNNHMSAEKINIIIADNIIGPTLYIDESLQCIDLFNSNNLIKEAFISGVGEESISSPMTLPPMCMPEEYQHPSPSDIQNVISSYRLYYRHEKVKFARYNYTNTPDWMPFMPI